MRNQKHEDKLSFLSQGGLCFTCLCHGHISSNCKRRVFCKVDSNLHPTILHINKRIVNNATEGINTKKPRLTFRKHVETCGHVLWLDVHHVP